MVGNVMDGWGEDSRDMGDGEAGIVGVTVVEGRRIGTKGVSRDEVADRVGIGILEAGL